MTEALDIIGEVDVCLPEAGEGFEVDLLSPAWQKFVWNVLRGEELTDAYLAGHPEAADKTAYVAGYRLMQDGRIKSALAELQEHAMRANLKRLEGLQTAAISTIRESVEKGNVSDTRLRAARDILDRTGLVKRQELGVKAETGSFESALESIK